MDGWIVHQNFCTLIERRLRTTGTEYKLVATRILNKALVLPNKAQCSNLGARLRHRYKKLDLKLDFKYNAINYFSDYLSEQHFKL